MSAAIEKMLYPNYYAELESADEWHKDFRRQKRIERMQIQVKEYQTVLDEASCRDRGDPRSEEFLFDLRLRMATAIANLNRKIEAIEEKQRYL